MRIDNLTTPPPVKGKSGARIAAGAGGQAAEARGGTGLTDRVSLSGLSMLAGGAGGAGAGRIEQLHGDVASRSYSIPALEVGRRILEYALAG